MAYRVDLVGRLFGALKVTAELPRRLTPRGQTQRYFKTQCQCGSEGESSYANLTSGQVKSCGCVKAPDPNHYGDISKTEAFKRWLSIKARVQRKVRKAAYLHVTISPEWMDFRVFLRDMGECPAGFTIERIDNRKGYEMGNCVWASNDQQANNKNKSVRVLVGGEWITMREACKVLGLTLGQVQARCVAGRIEKRNKSEVPAFA
jgi:hypothetical protein